MLYNAISRRKMATKDYRVKNTVNFNRVQSYFPERVRLDRPVKDKVNITQGTMLFSQERLRNKITPSKLVLTVRRVQAILAKKSEIENHTVKNRLNNTESPTLISQERVRLKITQPKIALTVHRAQSCFPKKGKDYKSHCQILALTVPRVQCHIPGKE